MDKNNIFKNYLILFMCIIYMFQYILLSKYSIFSFFDEAVIIFLLFYYILRSFKNGQMEKEIFKYLKYIILLIFIGLLGNFLIQYQTHYIPIFRDIFYCFKVFLTFFLSMSFMEYGVDKKWIIKKLSFIVSILMIFAFFCMLVNQFRDIGMSGDIRYGIKSFAFIFNTSPGSYNPGTFELYCYIYILILTINLKYTSNDLKKYNFNLFMIIISLIVWLSTLRSRAFAFVIFYILFYFLVIKHGKKINNFKQYNLKKYLIPFSIASIIAVRVGYEKLVYYLSYSSRTARAVFIRNSITIANKYAPIGSGFATFGTDTAYRYYSALYKKLGMNYVFGLSEDFGGFASDTYWPAILAQFGWLGLLVMIIFLFNFFKLLFKISANNKYNFFISLFITFITLGSSIATATFFHFSTAGLFFILCLAYDSKNNYKED